MISKAQVTPQLRAWCGEFGHEYTQRSCLTPEQVDALWEKNFGTTRTELNRRFLANIPAGARILEVGCNTGNQLLLLQRLGYCNLYGIEVQDCALEIARSRMNHVKLTVASAFALPFEDKYFDLVFTSGVLIHVSPNDLPLALDEIHRCAKNYVWGCEYYASNVTEINYRGHSELLWKMDYAKEYLARFDDLELVSEQRLSYIENQNVDSMFLLRKVARAQGSSR
ncbi:MAG TPA: pseudaminic acid biosynthesis-associated methylase [Terriglobales bacterium]|nr:pseudaminic acid biosynthesis-associated methylase [Terriglobales bacterium]